MILVKESVGTGEGRVMEGGGKEGVGNERGDNGKERGRKEGGREEVGSEGGWRKRSRQGRSEAEKLTESVTLPAAASCRISDASTFTSKPLQKEIPATTPRQNDHGSTLTRPSYYLLGRPASSLINS